MNIAIEIVYATPEQQWHKKLCVSESCNVQTAIEQSGFLDAFPDMILAEQHLGIFSQKATLSTLLKPGDRIEIYRPLMYDPMIRRKLKAYHAHRN